MDDAIGNYIAYYTGNFLAIDLLLRTKNLLANN